jgi:hypothetical protein
MVDFISHPSAVDLRRAVIALWGVTPQKAISGGLEWQKSEMATTQPSDKHHPRRKRFSDVVAGYRTSDEQTTMSGSAKHSYT